MHAELGLLCLCDYLDSPEVKRRSKCQPTVVAQLPGHAHVDTTLNVYTQVLDGALRTAVDKIGGELFTIVHEPESSGAAGR